MTSMPASRNARAMTLAPRSWPSRPGFATNTRILVEFIWAALRRHSAIRFAPPMPRSRAVGAVPTSLDYITRIVGSLGGGLIQPENWRPESPPCYGGVLTALRP